MWFCIHTVLFYGSFWVFIYIFNRPTISLGMAKVKMSKEESGSQDFIEKRRAALER